MVLLKDIGVEPKFRANLVLSLLCSAEQNADGTYTIMLSSDGAGKNGIPTGKDFYLGLRAYVPVAGANVTLDVVKK